MLSSVRLSALAVVMFAAPLFAQNPAMAAARDSVEKAAPAAGAVAPDFSAMAVGGPIATARSVKLSEFRGKVVVLAFYPADRSSGCTAELSKFRDEHDAIFGKDVVVLPISVDGADSHASWAQEAKFPFALVVDDGQSIARLYGSAIPGRNLDSRTVWVIGKDGKVAYRNMRFQALAADAYTELTSEIAKAKQ